MRSPRIFATALFAAAALTVLSGCASDDGGLQPMPSDSPSAEASTEASTEATTEASDGGAGSCEYAPGGSAAKEVNAPDAAPSATGDVTATMETSAGTIGLTLDGATTPCTVNSFVSLAEQGYFDDTECHRLTTSGIFVLQCGDPSATGRGGPGYSFDDELSGSETYPAGTLAMANAGPDTNGSQFFLVYADTKLPPSYTVFGQMDEAGLAVVEAIAAKGAVGGGGDGAPAEAVTISSISIS